MEPAQRLSVRWAEESTEGIAALCAGSPYLLQLYADAAWRAATPDAGAVISPREVGAGVTIAERTLWDGQYRGRWNRATPAERELLGAIADSLDECGIARAADIGDRLGKTNQQFSRDRANLVDKGLIEAVGHGRLSFAVPGFERFVRTIADQERGDPPSPGRTAPGIRPTPRGPELGC